MPIGILFWFLMIVTVLVWLGALAWTTVPVWISTVLVFVLFALLGWKVFGPALHS